MSSPGETPGQPPARLTRQKLAGLLVLLLGMATLLAGAIAIFLPFAAPIVIATVLTILALPSFQWILRLVGTRRRALASGLTCGLLLLALLGPLVGLGFYLGSAYPAAREQVLRGADDFHAWVKRPEFLRLIPVADWAEPVQSALLRTLEQALPRLREATELAPTAAAAPKEESPPKLEAALPMLEKALAWLQMVASVFGSVFKALIQFFLVLFLLFFFLKDGKQILEAIQSRIPLERSQQDDVVANFNQVTRSVVRGSLLTAGAQGLIATVGYAILGLPAVILGPLTAVAALVPPFGTGLIMVPVGLGLGVLYGSWGQAVFLLVLCAVVGALDNILKPILLREGGLQVHSIWLLLAILGGIDVFGPMGFLYGPLVLVLLGTFVALFVGGAAGEPGARRAPAPPAPDPVPQPGGP